MNSSRGLKSAVRPMQGMILRSYQTLLRVKHHETLAIWLELEEEKQSVAKEILKMTPAKFVSLCEFHCTKLRPGEALSVFMHELKQ